MSREEAGRVRPRPRGLAIIWFLAAAVVVFAIENVWIDAWLRDKSRQMPTLVPEPQSGAWFVAFLVVVAISILLVVAQILVSMDRGTPMLKRIGTGFATLVALLMCVLWVRVTSGMSPAPSLALEGKGGHSVTLTWKASESLVVGYNVYRSMKPGGPFKRINPELIKGLTYEDRDVRSGKTYYYATRAVDAKGDESGYSNQTTAKIP